MHQCVRGATMTVKVVVLEFAVNLSCCPQITVYVNDTLTELRSSGMTVDPYRVYNQSGYRYGYNISVSGIRALLDIKLKPWRHFSGALEILVTAEVTDFDGQLSLHVS